MQNYFCFKQYKFYFCRVKNNHQQKISIMKITNFLLSFLSVLSQTAKAQVVPLFHTTYDSTCLPYTPISNGYIINDALSYTWNFGNGITINQKNPNYSYTQVGNFRLSLTIATNATDKMVNSLTITAIPSNWDDRGNKDVKPDLYFILKDSSGNTILKSNIVFDMFPPLTFTTNFLIKTGKTYTVEVWEYDDIGMDDLLSYIPINSSPTTNTFSNSGGTIVVASLTNTTYTFSKNIRLYNQPTVNITFVNGLLYANVIGGIGGYYDFSWQLNGGNRLYNMIENTYKPTANGVYTVTVSSSNCTATSPPFTVSRVSAEDLSVLQNIRIYPNPSVLGEKKSIFIQSLESKTLELMISDISGKTINHQIIDLKIGDNTFDILNIDAKGFYFVQLLDKNKTIFLGKTTVF